MQLSEIHSQILRKKEEEEEKAEGRKKKERNKKDVDIAQCEGCECSSGSISSFGGKKDNKNYIFYIEKY